MQTVEVAGSKGTRAVQQPAIILIILGLANFCPRAKAPWGAEGPVTVLIGRCETVISRWF